MLHHLIIARLLKHQCSPNFWIGRNGAATLAAKNSALERKHLGKGYVISYLQNSCGLSSEKAIRASKWLHFDGPDKPNAVVDFLGKQGFTQSQITKIVEKFPGVLVANPERRLLPMFEFLLHSTGISDREILEIVCKIPALLVRSSRTVASVYNYVKSIIGVEKTNDLLRKGSWALYVDVERRLKPNVDYLREVGVAERSIAAAFVNCLTILLAYHVELRRLVAEVKQIGFDPSKSTFLLAVKSRWGKGHVTLWDRCVEVYKKWGWTEQDIRMAYITNPNCMLLSEMNISTTLDYLVNTLGLESRTIARVPQALLYSLERRIVPRCSVVRLLSLEGLIKKDWSLTSVLNAKEERFLDKYVLKYTDKMPQLYDIYQSRKCK